MGSRIRDNPVFEPTYCNRFVGLQWDQTTLQITFGYAARFAEHMGDKTLGEMTVSPVRCVAVTHKVAKELHEQLGQMLQAIEHAQREVPN